MKMITIATIVLVAVAAAASISLAVASGGQRVEADRTTGSDRIQGGRDAVVTRVVVHRREGVLPAGRED